MFYLFYNKNVLAFKWNGCCLGLLDILCCYERRTAIIRGSAYPRLKRARFIVYKNNAYLIKRNSLYLGIVPPSSGRWSLIGI
jgi:hypothetical protein